MVCENCEPIAFVLAQQKKSEFTFLVLCRGNIMTNKGVFIWRASAYWGGDKSVTSPPTANRYALAKAYRPGLINGRMLGARVFSWVFAS